MSTSPDQTGQTSQLAQGLPGFDPASAIASVEQGLLGSLGAPLEQILGELPLQQFGGSPAGLPANLAGGLANQIDPLNLIGPVISGLGALGTGQFSGIDPTQIFRGIFSAFDGNMTPLQQAMGSAANDWQGESGAAANAATQAVVVKGAAVANQANGIGNNLSGAASDVAQARQQMIEIIDDYHAKVAASNLSTPSGRATALAAANQASQEASAVMKELQGNLGAQAGELSKLGAPIGVTRAVPVKTSGGNPPRSFTAKKMSGGDPSTPNNPNSKLGAPIGVGEPVLVSGVAPGPHGPKGPSVVLSGPGAPAPKSGTPHGPVVVSGVAPGPHGPKGPSVVLSGPGAPADPPGHHSPKMSGGDPPRPHAPKMSGGDPPRPHAPKMSGGDPPRPHAPKMSGGDPPRPHAPQDVGRRPAPTPRPQDVGRRPAPTPRAQDVGRRPAPTPRAQNCRPPKARHSQNVGRRSTSASRSCRTPEGSGERRAVGRADGTQRCGRRGFRCGS